MVILKGICSLISLFKMLRLGSFFISNLLKFVWIWLTCFSTSKLCFNSTIKSGSRGMIFFILHSWMKNKSYTIDSNPSSDMILLSIPNKIRLGVEDNLAKLLFSLGSTFQNLSPKKYTLGTLPHVIDVVWYCISFSVAKVTCIWFCVAHIF